MQMFECEWARRCLHLLCVSCAEEAGISPSIISPAHALLHLLYVLCFMRVNTATNNFLFSFFYFFLILLSFFANRPTYEEITVRVVNMLPSLAPTLAASAQHLLIEPAKQAGRGKVLAITHAHGTNACTRTHKHVTVAGAHLCTCVPFVLIIFSSCLCSKCSCRNKCALTAASSSS